MDAAEGRADHAFIRPFRDTGAPQQRPVLRRSLPRRAKFRTAKGLLTGDVVSNTKMNSATSTAGAITTAVPASANVHTAQACATGCTEGRSRTSSHVGTQTPSLPGQELSAGASSIFAGADSAAMDAATFGSAHKASCGARRSRSIPTTAVAAGMRAAPTANIAVPKLPSPALEPTARPSHFHSSALGATSTSFGVDATVGVGQSTRGLEQDSGLENCARSGVQQSPRLLSEVDFTGSNSGWADNSGWTDSTNHNDAPRTTTSRPVLQAETVGSTASVPGNTPPRCPSPPTLAEIQSNLTYPGESTTPRESDVAATTAEATRADNSSHNLTSPSASETSVEPSAAATAVSDGQIRFEHVTYCSVCGRWPGAPPEGTPEDAEVVFCGTCPRKFCLSCFQISQTPGTLASETGQDDYSIFRRIPGGCDDCRLGTDREVPMQVPMRAGESHQLPHADVAVVEIMRVMKVMVQWLGSHDLARFFVEDVDESRIKGYRTRVKNPMSLAEICRKIDNKKYAEDPEKSIKLFLRDLALIESNCKRFNKKLAGISRSAALLVERAHLYYHTHIEPLAAELGFPHVLGMNCTCNRRVRVGGNGIVASRGNGEQDAGIDGATVGTGDRASTSPQRCSAAPPTSFSSNSAEPWDQSSTSPPSRAQSDGILSPGDSASSCGASAGSMSPVDSSTDPITDAVTQARTAHTALCYICGRSPDTGHRGRSDGEEVIFCRECPRMACASCHMTKQPTADRSEWERGRDTYSVFWFTPYCGPCLSKAGSQTSSAPTSEPAVAPSTSVGRESRALAAAADSKRLITADISTASLKTGSAKLQAHFEADQGRSGIVVRERFPVGQVVWVYTTFAAELPLDGFVAEVMHVPGFIQDRKQAAGTSPAMFTVNCFGPAEAVVQVTADRLSLFPMEGDWDSAKCAVADGLWPEEACDTNYLNFVLALAMLECIKSSWNSETGTNINHGMKALDRIEIDKRTKEYAETWGMDSTKLAQLIQQASSAGAQGGTRTTDGYSDHGDSRVLDAGGGDGMGVAVPLAEISRGDSDNNVGDVKAGAGAAAEAARSPSDERTMLPPCRNLFETPPPFDGRDFAQRGY